MILLRRLRVRALKHLRDIDIHFPRRGSILIEGHNESGKSTLFEAVYFALYGLPLVSEDSQSSRASLIPHGETHAGVSLTLLAGETRLEIHRTLIEGKHGKSPKHEVSLTVRQPGKPPEHIGAVAAANARILQELRGLDGGALRNSCLMEQQALDRIESLSRADREEAVAKLLGLGSLRRVRQEMAPTRADEERISVLRARRDVAQARHEVEQAERAAAAYQERLAYIQIARLVAERDALAATSAALRHQREELAARISQVEDAVRHAGRLESLFAALDSVATEIAHARESARERDRTVGAADVAGIQRALDAARQRQSEIARLESDWADAETAARIADDLLHALHAEDEAADAQHAAATALAQAEREEAEANQLDAQGRSRALLDRWLRLGEVAAITGSGETRVEALRVTLESAARAVAYRAGRARRMLVPLIGIGAGALLLLALGVAVHLAWLGAAILALLAVLLGWQYRPLREARQRAEQAYAEAQREFDAAVATLDAARQLSGAGDERDALEAEMRTAGIQVPTTAAAAREQLVSLPSVGAEGTRERLAEAQRRVAECRAALQLAESRLRAAREARAAHGAPANAPEAMLASQLAAARQARRSLAERADALGVALTTVALAAARGAAGAEVQRLEADLADHSRRAGAADALAQTAGHALASARESFARAARACRDAGIAVPDTPDASLDDLAQAHDRAQSAVRDELAGLDAPAMREELGALRTRHTSLSASLAETEGHQRDATTRLVRMLAERDVTVTGEEPLDTLQTYIPQRAAELDEGDALQRDAERTAAEVAYWRRRAGELAQTHHLADTPLDLDECVRALAEAEGQLRRRRLAGQLAGDVFTRIVQRVLPETAIHMRALLPELTAGRYRDVQLLGDEESADLRIRVWDQEAGRYVAKNLFSGGTRDQCSLALRLAFALATLPKELGALPGFIFLDEPLSSFDADRSRALVSVLTSGTIAQAFAQVFLISHSQGFDPRTFRYAIRMENGRIAASNLPGEREAQQLWEVEMAVAAPASGEQTRA